MPRPPASVLLAYRFVGWRVGPVYRDWVLDDIVRRGWLVRQGAPALAAVMGIGAVASLAIDGDVGKLATLLVVLAGAGAFLRQSLRELALRQQGIDASGHRLPHATWYDDDVARRRRNVLGTVSTVVLVVGSLVLLASRTGP